MRSHPLAFSTFTISCLSSMIECAYSAKSWLTLSCYFVGADDALEQQKFISSLSRPADASLNVFREWLQREKMGACPLLGKDGQAWDKKTQSDLVTLNDQRDRDSLTNWVCNSVIPNLHPPLLRHLKKPVAWDPESGLSAYPEPKIIAILDILGTIISSLFSISSITILYFINDMPVRLGVVAAFTALFALALALMTRASRPEIFAATTA